MVRLKRLKKIRIHREGTHTLAGSFLLLLFINAALYWGLDTRIPFYITSIVSLVVYGIMVNFFRCPIRLFGKDTEKVVVAPADGKVVVVEELSLRKEEEVRVKVKSLDSSKLHAKVRVFFNDQSFDLRISPDPPNHIGRPRIPDDNFLGGGPDGPGRLSD